MSRRVTNDIASATKVLTQGLGQEPQSHALPKGCTLHWYEIEVVLGQGGFGITYLARDNNLGHKVAVKEFFPIEFAIRGDGDEARPRTRDDVRLFEWGLERFIVEARTLAKFKHPNIVRILSVFEGNGTAYMAMEYEEGESLGLFLESGVGSLCAGWLLFPRTSDKDFFTYILVRFLSGLHGSILLNKLSLGLLKSISLSPDKASFSLTQSDSELFGVKVLARP